ncbi:MAG: NAD-dependent epimerase/dehydratase family protein [Methanobrevibacter sp.]|jgi:UDP-glucose 4-epimerase|nr:NAD-dependent epimerase/dehydratase family protein [Candidatus Methanovirga meridionalis]
MKNKKILITGGLGFIGSHAVEELVEDNEILIIDNESSGKIKNIENPNHSNLNILIDDLNIIGLKEVLEGVDYVFHFAAMANVHLSIKNPFLANKNNVVATIKLLEAVKDSDIKKFIFASSSAVYGDNLNIPLKESELPSPTSPYAASKASCELYLKSFYESYGLESVAFRFFNVFGPRQDPNSQYAAVIPKFIDAIMNNRQPVIFGDGEQTRDFVFVKDLVKANIIATKSKFNGVLNLGSGHAITINQLYYIIKDILQSNLEPTYMDERVGDIKHSQANVDNLNKILFKVDPNLFKTQLKNTVEWFLENH